MGESSLIYSECQASGEVRTVSMATTDRGLEIAECTKGPDTLALYGDPVHKQVLTLGERAKWALTRTYFDGTLAGGLRRAFATGELAFVSDIQDLLDCAEIPYAYAAYGPDGCAYRPYFE